MLRDAIESENRILGTLSAEEYQLLEPHLEPVVLDAKQVIYEPGDRLSHIYFCSGAMVSIVAVMENGVTVEVALIGREGMVGAHIILGDGTLTHRVIVQIAGHATRISVEAFKAALEQSSTLQKYFLLYIQALFTQIGQGAVCNRLHTIEERLARWMLSVQDGIQTNEFKLTQEFIAEMIGIRRSSVTVAAGMLQQEGAIRYSRGRINILDRSLLEATSCDCYRIIKQEFQRLMIGEGNLSPQ